MNKKHIQFAYIMAGFIAFCYVVIRAINMDVTYDESWTIGDFVPLDVMGIISYEPCDANNHITNTLLIKLFFLSGNHSLFLARLPNILAFVLYSYFGYKIVSQNLSPLIGICCYLLLLFNPFVLDFFSIARGYGLALGFLLASIYLLTNYLKNHKPLSAFYSICFGSLAVVSSFSILNYWLALFLAVNVIALFGGKLFNFKKTLLCSISGGIILLILIYEPIRKLVENGKLYYGGYNSFYSDTLVSLAKYSFYTSEVSPVIVYSLNIFLIILITSIIISYFYNRDPISLKSILLFIAAISILSVIMQHILLDTLYLIDRTALFFYPLLIFTLCFSLNDLADHWYSKIATPLITLAFLINFICHANVIKTALWYFDAHTYETLTWLNDMGKKENKTFKIYYSWPLQSSMEYYFKQHKHPYLNVIKETEESRYNPDADYYIFLTKPLDNTDYNSHELESFFRMKIKIKEYPNESIAVYSNMATPQISP